ncbi:MAG: 50S ribosomal protein L23 [Planctomycetes bacterium]|nr:50S ribosomal protein L23 [Planctomycetota bacterium]
MSSLDRLYHIIKAPVLTEKGTDDQQKRNAYTFRVPVDANKIEIKSAVETLFKVKVKAVNTLRIMPKVKRRGYVAGTSPAWKKAMVMLKEGDTIELL